MDLKGKKICFLGDSITRGTGTSSEEKRYTDVFTAITEVSEMKNYGIGGTRIAKQQKIKPETINYDINSFCERYGELDPDADIVVVFGGTNDYGHGDAPFGSFEDRTMDTYCGAIHYLMRSLIERYPTAVIVFMTPIHRANEWNPSSGNGLPLKAYVDKIKEIAEYYSIPVLDLYSVSGIQPDIPVQKEAYCPDGLHPNDAGAEKIARLLKGFLEAM
ncbi:MAG: SGNH/GDSL hydrolase family protein [Clostridia bacterium]|nr:SGNH/GDSL hydrolase family protein [Clostridia bacterium]